MNCFGEIEKIPVKLEDCFRRYHRRISYCNWNDSLTNDHQDRSQRSSFPILITETPNLVTKYSLDDDHLTPIQSWSFGELNKLIVPIASTNGRKFIGIHSCNTLIEWTLDENNELCETFKQNFNHQIIDIISDRRLIQPLILFSNGWIESLDRIKQDWSEQELNSVIDCDQELIIGIDYFIKRTKTIIIYYVVQSKFDKNLKYVYKCTLFFDDQRIDRAEKFKPSMMFQAWASSSKGLIGANQNKNTITVFSLTNLDLSENDSGSNRKDANLLEFEAVGFEQLCSMVHTSNATICFLGRNVRKNDSLNDYILDVYETNYSTKIGHLKLESDLFPYDFCAIKNRLLIASESCIQIITIANEKLLLSKLLRNSLMGDSGNEIKRKNFDNLIDYLGFRESIERNNQPLLTEESVVKIKTKFLFLSTRQSIPEELIVLMLCFCVKQIESFNGDNLQENTGLHTELLELFNALIALPFNEIFLVSCLKSSSITLDQYLLIIDLLLQRWPTNDPSIITWISSVLDANHNQLIVRPSPKAIETLNKINEHISKNIDFFQGLGSVKIFLESIMKREKSFLSTISNEKRSIGQYSIEMLTFT
ncbi:hypothetical protein SSS_08095 [Sarcoptes scabiei]|uniref:Uncharacterized protein n=1 Tax=Sarcoptes scabiei TaxID=52283 RepID=A0A834RC98_SARSC|nr:hypothetical protein SSS_08095 [Sarcoptes scabiei]